MTSYENGDVTIIDEADGMDANYLLHVHEILTGIFHRGEIINPHTGRVWQVNVHDEMFDGSCPVIQVTPAAPMLPYTRPAWFQVLVDEWGNDDDDDDDNDDNSEETS